MVTRFVEVLSFVPIGIHCHLRDIDSLSDSVTHIQYVVVFPDSAGGAAVLLLHG